LADYKNVILGGGMVAGYAARELVARGLAAGELAIISDDLFPPYERPPLSKGFLAGREQTPDILINDEEFYADHGIAVMLGTCVERVDFGARCLYLERGKPVSYAQLVIATGAHPRRLDAPGGDLDGLHYLRTIGDARAIREHADNARRAVAVGGGFVSMEVASVLTSLGVQTTMVFPEARVWEQLFTPEISAFFETYYRDRGVRIVPGQTVAAFDGGSGVEAVVTSGGERLEAEMAVVGAGIEPNVALFEATPLKLDHGIVVNEYLETGVPGVYAAGDVVRYRDLLFGKMRRADHWDNAVEQGKHVAALLTGDRRPFVHVPYFFSDVFDLSYEYWGDTEGATSVVYRGDVASGSFSAWWQRRETVIAAFVLNRPDQEREMAPLWIAERYDVPPERLRTADDLGKLGAR
jgi:NADPH-dependent 2,4-dienoyl-CoA reductase/sulfur reductase-like enzyme